MAKVRVYELAKDLNMTNKALLNKMKELKIEVKSHMRSHGCNTFSNSYSTLGFKHKQGYLGLLSQLFLTIPPFWYDLGSRPD